MKILITVLILISINVFAETKPLETKSKPENVESIVKEAKKDRKKKVEMCHECGKPEEQCDCKGEEHRKDEE